MILVIGSVPRRRDDASAGPGQHVKGVRSCIPTFRQLTFTDVGDFGVRSFIITVDTGNALRFYIKANAGIGAGNRISATLTAIKGQAVNESLASSGNNLFEEQTRFFASEGLRTGFTVEGTVKLTFTGSAPPQGSRLNLMV
ncbi:MAG: hypothetical protein ACK5YB_05835, partial [Burkholderiales bacterium]